MSVPTRSKVRFGPFELDPQPGELFKLGQKLNLHGQPIEVLSMLLEHPGELIAREEFCQRLWPKDTFVDFEHSLNTAIKKLRQTLDDDPDAPRYIETLPKKGYRFIAQVEAAPKHDDPIVETVNASIGTSATPTDAEHAATRKSRWKLSAAILLVLAVAAGALYWHYRPRTPVITGVHQLTRTGHHKAFGGVQQVVTDGTRVYFDEEDGVRLHIAQVSTKGGDVSYLDIPFIYNPWVVDSSADACELLVLDNLPDKFDNPVWLVSLPNGPQRKIGNLEVTFARLLPGSKQFVYTQAPNYRQLFSADRDGGNVRAILSSPFQIVGFRVSPDGKMIRFGTWEYHLDGTGLHRFLPQFDKPICCGNWSPDGGTYAFVSRGKQGADLWAVIESGTSDHMRVSPPVQLTYGPISFGPPTFSKDGGQIFALGQTQRGELSVYDSASAQFQRYLNGISASYVDFSRDGKWITYVSHPEGALWRSRIDGSERMQLTFPPMESIINPQWSPDRRLIAFTEWGAVDNRVYVVPAGGGSPMLLLAGDFHPADSTWSPDGKSIAYGGGSVYGGTGTEIRILTLDSKQSKTIPGSQHMFSPRWSPDGHYIAALSEDMLRLFLFTVDTGRWKELSLPEKRVVGYPTWSHDGQYLYVRSNPDIYRVRTSDGQVELAASIRDSEVSIPIFGGWFGLTPDDRILVMLDRGTDELYALDLEYR